MFRNAGLILATLGLVVFAVGCGDDDAKKVDKGTGGNTQKDTGGGGVTLDQGGGGQLDSGGGGQLDTGGGTTGQTCGQIASCAANCSDSACLSACVSKGTADGAKKFNALMACIQKEMAGSCKSKCSGDAGSACTTCLQTACTAEYKACGTGSSTGTKGFGDKCGGTAGNCKAGFKCIGVQGGSKTNGFCTKTCPAASAGKPCTGHATGQMSFCGLSNAAKTEYYCAFLCKAQGQTWTCPTTLKCGTVTNGQAICVP